jgi:hypothetical protein
MEWVIAKDRLPEIYVGQSCSSWVLAYYSSEMFLVRLIEGHWKHWLTRQDVTLDIDDVTHWMPLPEPPEIK